MTVSISDDHVFFGASDKLFKVVDIPANVTISLINKLNKGRKKDN